MKILALDPATECGWAHSCGASGVWDLSIRKDESSGMRLVRFEGKMREVYKDVGIDLIVFEAPTVSRGRTANMDGLKLGTKLQAIIERITETTEGMECQGYNLQTIKSHALRLQTGKRNKEAMVKAAKKRWPHTEIADDNQADALWLLDLAQTQLKLR